MSSIEKKIRIVKLFNLYGSLLSSAQFEIVNDYYLADLSLSEISENRSVSRSAIEDALKKAEAKLEGYEYKLHYLEKSSQISSKLDILAQKSTDLESQEIIKQIKEDINYGI